MGRTCTHSCSLPLSLSHMSFLFSFVVPSQLIILWGRFSLSLFSQKHFHQNTCIFGLFIEGSALWQFRWCALHLLLCKLPMPYHFLLYHCFIFLEMVMVCYWVYFYHFHPYIQLKINLRTGPSWINVNFYMMVRLKYKLLGSVPLFSTTDFHLWCQYPTLVPVNGPANPCPNPESCL